MELLISQAADSDAQVISRLQPRWSEEDCVYGFVPESPEEVKAALSPYLLVAATNDEIIGLIFGSIRVSERIAVIPERERYLKIDNLYL